MRWAGLMLGIGLSLAAGAALACPDPGPCDDGPYDRYEDSGYDPYAWGEDEGFLDEAPAIWRQADGGWYIHGRRAAPCACRGHTFRGEVSLSGSFFADAGGVGPFPDGYGYGGGFVFFDDRSSGFSRAGARAFAAASARARANASVSFGRGFHGGGHGGRGGH